jgi:hypothetical protein
MGKDNQIPTEIKWAPQENRHGINAGAFHKNFPLHFLCFLCLFLPDMLLFAARQALSD